MFKTLFGKYDKRIDMILKKSLKESWVFPQKIDKTDGERKNIERMLIDAFMNESSTL